MDEEARLTKHNEQKDDYQVSSTPQPDNSQTIQQPFSRDSSPTAFQPSPSYLADRRSQDSGIHSGIRTQPGGYGNETQPTSAILGNDNFHARIDSNVDVVLNKPRQLPDAHSNNSSPSQVQSDNGNRESEELQELQAKSYNLNADKPMSENMMGPSYFISSISPQLLPRHTM